MVIVEDIQCEKIRKAIFETLPYMKSKSRQKEIRKDAMNINYSIALSDILEYVNDVIEKEAQK